MLTGLYRTPRISVQSFSNDASARPWELTGLDRTLRLSVRSFRTARPMRHVRESLATTASLNGTCGGQAATGRVRYGDRTRSVYTNGASGENDLHVRSSRKTPSEEVTASLAHRAINRRWSRPWLVLSTSGDFVSMLESAWEPSISHMLDCDHLIV